MEEEQRAEGSDRPSIVLTEQCFYSSTVSSLWMSSSDETKEGAESRAISTSLYALLDEVCSQSPGSSRKHAGFDIQKGEQHA